MTTTLMEYWSYGSPEMKFFLKKWANTLTGTIFFLFAVTLYLLVPSQIAMLESVKLSLSPTFYPILIIVLIAIISTIYIITSFVEEKKNLPDSEESTPADNSVRGLSNEAKRTLITIGIIVGFIYLIEFMGFFIATPIGLAMMMFHMGTRRIWVFIIIMIVVPPITYFVFEKAMLVILPKGIFF